MVEWTDLGVKAHIMNNYDRIVQEHSSLLKIQVMKIINDTTLKITYNIKTNLHCDFGICEDLLNTFHSNKKGEFNRRISRYQNLTGRKMRLTGTDNSLGFTRLIYTI